MAANEIEDAVIAKLRELPEDKQREVIDFVSSLAPEPKRLLKSLYGLWAGQGVDISVSANSWNSNTGNNERQHGSGE